MDSTACSPLTPTTLLCYASIANRFPSRRNFSRAIAIGGGVDSLTVSTAKPVYTPTPRDRHLRTPHSGYHYDGSPRQFFEGWYFKVSIPEKRQSFCFMYAVDNPAFRKPLSTLEIAHFGTKTTGAAAQVLGPDDEYICQFSPDSTNFWGSKHELALGHTFALNGGGLQPPKRELPPEEFNRRVVEGFQVTPLWHQGFIRDDGRNDFAKAVSSMRWAYSTRPTYGWGDADSKQKATAGWLAAFPVFEPHWQICMASGLSTGWIEWDGKRYEFENAPSYSEKNWGCGFPRKWAWVQCNVFKGVEASLTSAVAIRKLPGPSDIYENVGMIGLHYDGKLYEFVPWYGDLTWEVTQWGFWRIEGENPTHAIELEATTEDIGCPLRAPTVESGFSPACKDTCFGVLRVKLWERKFDGSKGKVIMDAESEMAALEVGGGPWFCTWKDRASTPEILAAALRAPIDIDAIYNLFPLAKPPGF